jgi:hypothetical protein
MGPVFRDHIVICGWNSRGEKIVRALRAANTRTIVIIHPEIPPIIAAVGKLEHVFIIAGDPKHRTVLCSADVATSRSVIVLADEEIQQATDARSLQIALAVERIQASIYTIVELRDLRNKTHFFWTKVDEVVSDEDISVKSFAQGIRHIVRDNAAKKLVPMYRQLVDPHQHRAQLFRVDMDWPAVSGRCFADVLRISLTLGVLPVAVAGYRYHEIAPRAGEKAWVSWKCDVRANPAPHVSFSELWPIWPEPDWQLGILLLAQRSIDVAHVRQSLEKELFSAPTSRQQSTKGVTSLG